MSTMITYFVHSTSIDNEAGVRSGWNNPDLSDKGYEQAESLRDYLSASRFDAVYASDLIRAIHTATAVFPNIQVVQDSRLREMNYGVLNGKPGTEFPDDKTWCVEHRFEQGENCADVQSRMESFLGDVYNPSRNIAIFSHKYPQLALEVVLNGLSWIDALAQDWRHKGEWKPGWQYDRRLTCS